MKPTLRRYQTEDDYWRMREFLREIFLLNACLEQSWHVARLDYARFHGHMNCHKLRMEDTTRLWQVDGRIVAFAMVEEGWGDVHLNVHPEFRTPELEEEMLIASEEQLAKVAEDGSRKLQVWVHGADATRREVVSRRGYSIGQWPEHQWRRDLAGPVAEVPVPGGYTIRAVGDGLELLERCYASGLGFHQGDIKTAVDNRNDPTWYHNIQTAPLYRRDLDLVAVAEDGSVASFCTIWFDDVTRTAMFEPVATVPAHQRRGLAKALLTEGQRRLQRMGCLRSFVGGYEDGPNALYGSVSDPECEIYGPWVKDW